MTDALAIPDQSAALVPWSQMDDERREALRQVCNAAGSDKVRALTDAELQLLCEIGVRAGLDPIRKQIYGLIFKGRFTVMTGIDGFRATARRNGLAGIDAPKFSWQDEKKTLPYACEVTVYRWGPPKADGSREREAYTARGMLREYNSGTPIWSQKPALMLAKCVEALAHRMAFTESLGGIYERSELPDLDHTIGSRIRQTERAPVSVASFLDTTAIDVPALEPGEDRDPTDKDTP